MEQADERALAIGRRSSQNAFIALSGLLLAMVVMHVVEQGLGNISAVRFEIGGFLLGQVVYFGSGLYYKRRM